MSKILNPFGRTSGENSHRNSVDKNPAKFEVENEPDAQLSTGIKSQTIQELI